MFVTYLLARLLFTTSQLEDKTVCLGFRSECPLTSSAGDADGHGAGRHPEYRGGSGSVPHQGPGGAAEDGRQPGLTVRACLLACHDCTADNPSEHMSSDF